MEYTKMETGDDVESWAKKHQVEDLLPFLTENGFTSLTSIRAIKEK